MVKYILIPLSGKRGEGKFAIIDAEDFEKVKNFTWYVAKRGDVVADSGPRGGRIHTKMHRLVTNAPTGTSVDHIHHDRLDNRKSELRVCTQAQNVYNMQSNANTSSPFKGVSWHKGGKKWVAQIHLKPHHYYLGYFKTQEEAARVYDAKAKELFGEHAFLNFPER